MHHDMDTDPLRNVPNMRDLDRVLHPPDNSVAAAWVHPQPGKGDAWSGFNILRPSKRSFHDGSRDAQRSRNWLCTTAGASGMVVTGATTDITSILARQGVLETATFLPADFDPSKSWNTTTCKRQPFSR